MTAATSKIERFVIIVDSFQPLTIITKRSLLDVAAALDPPLISFSDVVTFGVSVSLKSGTFEVPVTHFRPMFHLCRNQVVGFY